MTSDETAEGMISVIVPCHDSESTIKGCVDSIMSSLKDHRYEIIVVDDCSAQPVSGIFEGYPGNIQVVRNEKNMGAAFSRNRGMWLSSGKALVFVDSDVIVEEATLPCLCQHLAETDISFPSVVFDDGSVMHPLTSSEKEYIHYSTCFAMRRESADLIKNKDGHLFDEIFGNYGEDTDLFIRCRKRGLTCSYAKGGKAIHLKRQMDQSEGRFFQEIRNISLGRLKHIKDRSQRKFFGSSFSTLSLVRSGACCIFNFAWYDWVSYKRGRGAAYKLSCLLRRQSTISRKGMISRLRIFSNALAQSKALAQSREDHAMIRKRVEG